MEWLLKVIWVLPIATAVIGILGIIHGIRKDGGRIPEGKYKCKPGLSGQV